VTATYIDAYIDEVAAIVRDQSTVMGEFAFWDDARTLSATTGG
jgi:hypothetical protein